jgi:exodeoxyribonuclease VII large subunit
VEARATDGEAISVAELTRRLRRAVESSTGREWVEGEVAGLRAASSGHLYFSLKDEREDACVDCVMYRMQALRGRRLIRDGARVQIYGRATVWAPRGRLQFIAEVARPAGKGALLAALEALKEKLSQEGLFDPARKRPLPKAPRVVGVVTSAHGAAIHDIVTVAFRRGGVRIVLSPALVQGDFAPQSIVTALDRLERYPGLDVVIVGRGGGSNEDLMAFNDERVVRRVARASVPVVSAVGHEVDTTLTDWVADVRAATPSHAAELVVPDTASRAEALARLERALLRAVRVRLSDDAHVLSRLRAKLQDPRFAIAERQQLVDELTTRLERRMERSLARRKNGLDALSTRLSARHPRVVVARARAELRPLTARLTSAARRGVERARGVLGETASRLDALSPLSVLSRGYAIATGADGRALRRADEVAKGEAVRVRLHEGALRVTVVDAEERST